MYVFLKAEDGIRDATVTGVQTCALPIDRKSTRLNSSHGSMYAVSLDRKSTRLNSSHGSISYAVFCLKKKKTPPSAVPGRPLGQAPASQHACRRTGATWSGRAGGASWVNSGLSPGV